MDRKTKSLTTPSGAVVEMKEYLTAGEFIDLNDENEKEGLTKGQLAKRLMDSAVVSINGVTENIPTLLRDLRLTDYTFLSKEIATLIQGDFSEAKTQTSA
jgi:hypothetical protein